METYKIQTLQKMLEQEKLNLERLKGDTNNPSYKLSEANIKKLREQLRQVGAEVRFFFQIIFCVSSPCPSVSCFFPNQRFYSLFINLNLLFN